LQMVKRAVVMRLLVMRGWWWWQATPHSRHFAYGNSFIPGLTLWSRYYSFCFTDDERETQSLTICPESHTQ
jgi:hypothetical protein